MNARERVWAALSGGSPDRPPLSFWGHLYDRESSAADLAAAAAEAQSRYGWDWVKLNPRKHYHVEPWGVAYRYSGSRTVRPVLESWPVHRGEDWAGITPRVHDQGALGEQIEAVRLTRAALPADVPLIETVFTPLAILGEMVETPQDLRQHMRTHPDRVRAALETVTATFEKLVGALLQAGAEGIFLATVDWGSLHLLSPGEYREWSRPYDLRLLAAARGAPFNVLHVCKGRNLLLELADYPVSAFSWDALDPTNPGLATALHRLRGAAMGGISFDSSLATADPERFAAEYRRALESTGGRRWLAAPGCSIPPATAAENLEAVRAAATSTRLKETPLP
jgi:uroporphyrinogen decarboxylase